jgi:hypothetical protein
MLASGASAGQVYIVLLTQNVSGPTLRNDESSDWIVFSNVGSIPGTLVIME